MAEGVTRRVKALNTDGRKMKGVIKANRKVTFRVANRELMAV